MLLLACGSPHFFHAFFLLTFKKQPSCNVCDTIIIVKLPAMLPSEKALKNTPTPSSHNRSRFTTDHHLQSRASVSVMFVNSWLMFLKTYCGKILSLFKNRDEPNSPCYVPDHPTSEVIVKLSNLLCLYPPFFTPCRYYFQVNPRHYFINLCL